MAYLISVLIISIASSSLLFVSHVQDPIFITAWEATAIRFTFFWTLGLFLSIFILSNIIATLFAPLNATATSSTIIFLCFVYAICNKPELIIGALFEQNVSHSFFAVLLPASMCITCVYALIFWIAKSISRVFVTEKNSIVMNFAFVTGGILVCILVVQIIFGYLGYHLPKFI